MSQDSLVGCPLWKGRGRPVNLCFFPALEFGLNTRINRAGWGTDSFLVEGGGGSDDGGVNFKSMTGKASRHCVPNSVALRQNAYFWAMMCDRALYVKEVAY